jgi:16S rRNA processing protein RimM
LRYLAVGEITSPHGVRGDANVRILTDFPERLLRLKRVYMGDNYEPYGVESVRVQGVKATMKLAGIDSPRGGT